MTLLRLLVVLLLLLLLLLLFEMMFDISFLLKMTKTMNDLVAASAVIVAVVGVTICYTTTHYSCGLVAVGVGVVVTV